VGNKDIYKKVAGMQTQVDIHLKKIKNELEKEFPDYGLIHHWESEIRAWQARIHKLLHRIKS
jgi:hypothetical protein